MDRIEGKKPRAAKRICFAPETEGSRALRSRRSVTKRSAEDSRAGQQSSAPERKNRNKHSEERNRR